MSRKIVINLPEDKMRDSVLSGINKRISMMENLIKDSKKKKKNTEIADLRKQLKEVSGIRESLSQRDLGGLKQSMTSISKALSALGSIRIPSPS